jgi:lysophospholipase L1-like esterase
MGKEYEPLMDADKRRTAMYFPDPMKANRRLNHVIRSSGRFFNRVSLIAYCGVSLAGELPLVAEAAYGNERFTAAPASGALHYHFGTTKTGAGMTAVTAASRYSAESGFGFEAGASIQAIEHGVTCDQPFSFSVKLPEGNYIIELTFGDELLASTTTVKAEARRLMLENVPTAKGQVVSRQAAINVRTPTIRGLGEVKLKQREKDSEMVTWDDKLTLEFSGEHPRLRSLSVVPAPALTTVFIAGDSTVCDQPLAPWNSWGQMLTRFFKPTIAVANYAQSGESIRSSLSARRFDKIFAEMKPGDWLLVQFGHNDMKDRAPDALDVYRSNLKRIVAETRKRGGFPVLITSMERKAGVNKPTLAGYPEAVRAIASEDRVPLIDLHAMSIRFYQALGNDLDQAFQDGTHHSDYGSYELAKCVASGIANAKIDLADQLVDEVKSFDPQRPDPPSKFKIQSNHQHSGEKPDGN